ncbi:MAG: insulinase family protein [Bacteroidales bacterium]|nr:insulinase family protein [Bacteroidales bacterium]
MRTTPPPCKPVDFVRVVPPEKTVLDNGVPLYTVNEGKEEVVQLSLLWEAGSICQNLPLTAPAVCRMLSEGSDGYSGKEIAETVEFHGASLACSCEKDVAMVRLLTARRHLHRLLPLLADMVNCPAFPEKELQAFLARSRSHFLADEAVGRLVARKRFLSALFGGSHPYGEGERLEDFDRLTAGGLRRFHRNYYRAGRCRIVAAGKVTDGDVQQINFHLGSPLQPEDAPEEPPQYAFEPAENRRERVERKGSLQASVRIGKRACTRQHEDYAGLCVLNALLGGYFGSRLMRSLREEKGYTYGIHSSLIPLQKAGYFTITTETGADVLADALRGIYREMERLREEPVGSDELNLVKTFMRSEMLRWFDGPFARAESLIMLLENRQDETYYTRYMDCIRTIDAQELQRLAQKYLDTDAMYETVVV